MIIQLMKTKKSNRVGHRKADPYYAPDEEDDFNE